MNRTVLVGVTAVAAAVAGILGSHLMPASSPAQGSEAVAALRAELAETRHRLTLVENRNAIVNLNRIYGYYLDKAMFQELVDLFTDDVSLEYSGRGVFLGKKRALELMTAMPGGKTGMKPGMLQNHMQLQGVVHVADDGKTARGRWRAFIMMAFDGGRAAWQEGIYENEYRKEGDVWKFSKVHFYLNVNADYEKGWVKGAGGIPGVSEDMPPDLPPSDPNYQPYPTPFVPPFHYRHPVTGG